MFIIQNKGISKQKNKKYWTTPTEILMTFHRCDKLVTFVKCTFGYFAQTYLTIYICSLQSLFSIQTFC